MRYATRRGFLQRKKKAEDKITTGSLGKTLAKKQVTLSAEDLKIVDLIRARGCIHVPSIQVNTHIPSEEAIRRRMDILVSAGVIKAELTNARKRPEVIYYLGKRIPYNEISHNLYMSEGLDRFLSNPLVRLLEYKHEHDLKSEHSKGRKSVQDEELQVPDGAIKFESGGIVQNCFIEIDSKSYTGKVLRDKVTGLSKYVGNTSLYWVCYSSKRLNTVKEAVKPFANIRPIMFYELNLLS